MPPDSAALARHRTGPWGTRAWPWVIALLLLAVFGFWKPYFARLPGADLLTHVHVGLTLAWFALLLLQPVLVLRGRRDLHRVLGRCGHVLVPAIVVTAVLMARQHVATAPPEAFDFRAMVLFLGLGNAVLFAGFWALAIHHRRESALHARYMLATTLTLLDPVLARVMIFWARPPGVEDLQMVSYAVIGAILLSLIVLERRAPGAARPWRVPGGAGAVRADVRTDADVRVFAAVAGIRPLVRGHVTRSRQSCSPCVPDRAPPKP